MAPATTEERLTELLGPAVAPTGLVLDDVTIMPAGARSVVRVIVDLDEDEIGSADLDLLSEAAQLVSSALDDSDIFDSVDSYVLEVSTPGVDRVLREPRHFKRARTRLVQFAMADGSEVKGRLHDVSAEGCEVSKITGGVKGRPTKEHPPAMIAWSDIVSGQVQVEFNRIDEAELGPEIDDDAESLAEGDGTLAESDSAATKEN
ncbi:ribosome maturation factor RimP [Micrococcales bacterium 31B]|nr:ribosome maturation factor RimP [Micrococcales bacterium 31B]